MSLSFRDFVKMRGVWILPLATTAFTLSLLLLFANSLPDLVREALVPSLAVYLIGLGVLTFTKELCHRRYRADQVSRLLVEEEISELPDSARKLREVLYRHGEGPNLPEDRVKRFWWVQVAWFAALVVYNVCRGVL